MTRVVRVVSSGVVAGTQFERGVQRFCGIRYAVAERFARPTALPLLGEIDATDFGDACPQMPVFSPLVPGGALGVAESEDCLHLNVWIPEGAGPFPVLVWIHGGSFITGAASQAMYDGSPLAGLGVVVVSVNYRVGPLGFLDLRSIDGADPTWTANAGLHDQVAAFNWVRNHIAEFAGDAANVTVMGESAGGGSILHLLGASQRSTWFDRAIVFSGSAGFTFEPSDAATIASRFVAGSGTPISQLSSVDVSTLIAAIGGTMSDPDVYALAGMMPFHPSIDGDLVLDTPMAGLQRGAATGCDVWLSTTRDEMALFVDASPMEPSKLAKRAARYAGLDIATAEQLVESYRKQLMGEGLETEAVNVWAAILSDREMTLPIRGLLDAAVAGAGNVFGSLFTWDSPPRADGRPVGAAHATDLPFIFDSFDVDGWAEFVGATGPDRESIAKVASRALQSSIVKFCSDGDPGWPQWSDDRAMCTFGELLKVQHDPLRAPAELWEAIAS